MSKSAQILEINPPNELRFQGPFTQVVSSELSLINPSDKHVCFKIKTTAPKRYCVRPNSGILSPRQNLAVQVMLQPFVYDPNEKNKHKFMVQAVLVPNADADAEAVWKSANSGDVMDTKLKCVFDVPGEQRTSQVESSSPSKSPDSKQEQPRSGVDLASLNETINKLRGENEALKENQWKGQVQSASSSSSFSTMTIVTILIALILGIVLGKLIL